MKYRILVLLGAICYGILSTIVTKAYAKGYTLGEVVGSQLLTGFVLVWALVLFMKWKGRWSGNVKPTSSSATAARKFSWRHRVILMIAGVPTAVTGLLYYQSLRYIPNSLAILLLFQFTWMGVLINSVEQKRRPNGIMLITLISLFGGTLLAAGILDQG
ncbi:EamA family transporter, partial [Paenibacillus sp. LMG 31457]|nr:EamA family transporter [Paenibacillus planticolens]